MNLQRLAATIAAALLLLCLGWWQTSDPQVDSPGKPTYNGPVMRGLQVDVPQLPPFPAFYVNAENPFLPYAQRLIEKRLENPPTPGRVPPPPPARTKERPPWPAVVINEPAPKPVVLPTLTPAVATAPQCIGLIGGEEAQLLMVRMPGADGAVNIKVGQVIDGWTLVQIDNSNQAHFTDPSGAPQIFPIGDGDLAVAQTLVSPGSDAPSKPAKPGESVLLSMPKAPTPPQNGKGQGGQGGQGNGPRKPRRPGGQGQGQPGGGDTVP
jgi:hypothetical protein